MTTSLQPTAQDVATRSVAGIVRGDGFHWVGDGFLVSTVLHPGAPLARHLSPFLLLDYHAPHDYEPTDRPRGVGPHPHRGFETVTLAFDGAVAHHDSTGAGGVIGPGDVQWMTAAGGILHKEYHDPDWARSGGRFHMAQLWVNLPAEHKLDDPGYQPLLVADMGSVELADGAGTVTVIAGEYHGVSGPARTYTPINLWDVTLHPGGSLAATFDPDHNAALFVLEGDLVTGGRTATAHDLVVLDHDGTLVEATTAAGARFLVLEGEPIDEPIVSYGPFVMNTEDEIRQAIVDFSSGRFGHLD